MCASIGVDPLASSKGFWLKELGNGFTLIPLRSGRYLVQSIPGEFSMDQTAILQRAETNSGFVTAALLAKELGWDGERSGRALEQLTRDGLAWVDEQHGGGDGGKETAYWIPSI